MIEALSRVAHLFALLFAPRLLSPDPASGGLDFAILGVVILLAGPAIGVALVRQYEVLEAKFALGLALAGVGFLIMIFPANMLIASLSSVDNTFSAQVPASRGETTVLSGP